MGSSATSKKLGKAAKGAGKKFGKKEKVDVWKTLQECREFMKTADKEFRDRATPTSTGKDAAKTILEVEKSNVTTAMQYKKLSKIAASGEMYGYPPEAIAAANRLLQQMDGMDLANTDAGDALQFMQQNQADWDIITNTEQEHGLGNIWNVKTK
jgi:hypothetical protein